MKRDGEKLLRVARDGTMRTRKRSQREGDGEMGLV
jgi:uncharacterized C2H2 Zn-finger protein